MPADLAYRPAGQDDLPALHALIEGAYRGESARAGWTHEADLLEGPRTSREDLEGIVGGADEVMLLFHEGDGAPIACAHLARKSADTAYLGMLTVDPKRQSGGFGRHVIATAEREAARRGATKLALTVVDRRPELIAYYERRGFCLTGERLPFPIPLDPPFFLVAMEKMIGAA